MVQTVTGALVASQLSGGDSVSEVYPVFSLIVWENNHLVDEVHGEASMSEVGSNVAYHGWVGFLEVHVQQGNDLGVVGCQDALVDQVDEVVEVLQQVIGGCLVG